MKKLLMDGQTVVSFESAILIIRFGEIYFLRVSVGIFNTIQIFFKSL